MNLKWREIIHLLKFAVKHRYILLFQLPLNLENNLETHLRVPIAFCSLAN